jgi:hypothetical protein
MFVVSYLVLLISCIFLLLFALSCVNDCKDYYDKQIELVKESCGLNRFVGVNLTALNDMIVNVT